MAFRGTVLVVDDEQSVRALIRRALERAGYRVFEGCEGSEALQVLRTYPVDVLLTDWKMPGVDGLELLRRCRLLYPDLDVILMTGYASIENAVDTLRAGAYDYVTKPLIFKEIISKVDECLASRIARIPEGSRSAAMTLLLALADLFAHLDADCDLPVTVLEMVWEHMSPSFTAVFQVGDDGRPAVTSTRGRLDALGMDWMPRTAASISALADQSSPWLVENPDPDGKVFEALSTSAVSIPMMLGDRPVGLLRIERQDATHRLGAFDAQVLYTGALMSAEAMSSSDPSVMGPMAHRAADALLGLFELIDRAKSQRARAIGKTARRLAEKLDVDQEQCAQVELVACLADVGMVITPDTVSSASMPAHVLDGARLVQAFSSLSSIAAGVLYHHEAWDGSGYPEGLCGYDIPLPSRITAVATALHSDGLGSWGRLGPLGVLRAESGHHYDPDVVRVGIETAMVKKAMTS